MEKKKIESLQLLRVMAFLGILIEHCGGLLLGAWGVSVFLVLSGFLMVYNNYTEDLKCSFVSRITFSLRRIERLYPLHVITWLLAIPYAIGTMINCTRTEMCFKLLGNSVLNLSLIQSWVPNEKVYFSFNAVSWYLSTIVFCYFMFPVLIKKIKSNGWKFCVKSIVFTVGVQLFLALISKHIEKLPFAIEHELCDLNKWITYISPIYRLGDFYVGCCLGYFFITRQNQGKNICKPYIYTLAEIGSVVLVVLSCVLFLSGIGNGLGLSLIFLPSTCVLVWSFTLNKGIITRFLKKLKPLVYIGDLSGYCFLIHQLIIKYLETVAVRLFDISHFQVWLIVALTLFATVTSALLYRRIFNRFLKKHERI